MHVSQRHLTGTLNYFCLWNIYLEQSATVYLWNFHGNCLGKYLWNCLSNFHWNYFWKYLKLSVSLNWVLPPCASWHKKLCPGSPSRRQSPPPQDSHHHCHLSVGTHLANQERSWSFPQYWHWRRSAGTTSPKEWRRERSRFGLWWNVDFHWFLFAGQQWCEGYHSSQSIVTAPQGIN